MLLVSAPPAPAPACTNTILREMRCPLTICPWLSTSSSLRGTGWFTKGWDGREEANCRLNGGVKNAAREDEELAPSSFDAVCFAVCMINCFRPFEPRGGCFLQIRADGKYRMKTTMPRQNSIWRYIIRLLSLTCSCYRPISRPLLPSNNMVGIFPAQNFLVPSKSGDLDIWELLVGCCRSLRSRTLYRVGHCQTTYSKFLYISLVNYM